MTKQKSKKSNQKQSRDGFVLAYIIKKCVECETVPRGEKDFDIIVRWEELCDLITVCYGRDIDEKWERYNK